MSAAHTATTSAPFSLKDFLGSFMLFELFKGLAITGLSLIHISEPTRPY